MKLEREQALIVQRARVCTHWEEPMVRPVQLAVSPLSPSPAKARRRERLLGFLLALLQPSPEAPQRQRGHAWAGAAGRGAALPRSGTGRAARNGSAARCRRARCRPGAACRWQARRGYLTPGLSFLGQRLTGGGGEGPPSAASARPAGIVSPEVRPPPAAPAPSNPRPRLAGLGSAAAVPICGQNLGRGSVTPQGKEPTASHRLFPPLFSLSAGKKISLQPVQR